MRKLLKTCMPAPEPSYKTYTIKREENSSPSSFFVEYLDDAASLSQGDTEFDTFFWYRPVLLNNNWEVTAELNPNNFQRDIDDNVVNISGWDNVMIEFPRRWIKMSKTWNVVTLSITDNPDAEADGFQYYAHSRWTFDSPIKKDNFYLWVYKGRVSTAKNALVSWSWQTITTSTSFPDFIEYARANDWNSWDNWYEIQGFYQRMYIIALYMMKHWNPDVQTIIGNGYVNGSGIQTTWATNTLWMNGCTNPSTQTWRVKLFWLEDLRWNAHEFVWWYCSDTDYHIKTKLSNFNSDMATYTRQPADLVTNRQNYNVVAIAWDNTSMFMPTDSYSNSSYNTYYCDNTQILDSRRWYWWASYNQWKAAWLFRFYTGQSSATSTSSTNTTRLMYL